MLKFHQDILKFSLQTQCFIFMCSSNERSVNYATKMVRMLSSSMWEGLQSVDLVRFLWAKGHNHQIEIHRDVCGMYGEDCIDHSSVSTWCSFFKKLLPCRMCTTWRCCYSPYSLPHTHHTCPCVNFTLVMSFSHSLRTFSKDSFCRRLLSRCPWNTSR